MKMRLNGLPHITREIEQIADEQERERQRNLYRRLDAFASVPKEISVEYYNTEKGKKALICVSDFDEYSCDYFEAEETEQKSIDQAVDEALGNHIDALYALCCAKELAMEKTEESFRKGQNKNYSYRYHCCIPSFHSYELDLKPLYKAETHGLHGDGMLTILTRKPASALNK